MLRYGVPMLGLIALAVLIYISTVGKAQYRRTEVSYTIPSLTLIDQNANPVPLRSLLEADRPVLLEFIFTSCTDLCPTQSVKFTNFQRYLQPDPTRVHLVSITIDPETDRPPLMRQYLAQFGAQPGWTFLTGDKAQIRQVMDAFGIQPSDMITLKNSLLMRSPTTGQWYRFDGELGSDAFIAQYEQLAK